MLTPREKGAAQTPAARPADRPRAERADHVWSIDLQWDQTADGHTLKLLQVIDTYTREALAIKRRRRIDADQTADVVDRLVVERGRVRAIVRSDDRPEMTANALRDWCRFLRHRQPGSPWQNPCVERSAPGCRRRP